MLSVQQPNRNSSTLQGGGPQLQASSGSGAFYHPAMSASQLQPTVAANSLHQTANPQGAVALPNHLTQSVQPNTRAAEIQATTAPTSTAGTGTSGGYNYGYNTGQFNPAQAQQIADLYNSAYDQKIGTLKDLLGRLPERQQGLNDEIGRQYDSEVGTLNTGHAQALRDLALGRGQLDQNHDLTLRNIGQDATDTNNGLNYKVGTMTPYDSSATPLIALALAKSAERQRGDVGQQYGFQQTGFKNKETDNENNFGNSVNSVNVWKQNNLQDIARNVGDYQDQLNGQVADTNASRQMSLAQLANYNGSSILGNIQQMIAQYNPNNINYKPVDHQAVQNSVQAMTNNIPQVQQFNVPSLGVIN